MKQKSSRGTPAEQIASTARTWRQHDQVAIADKRDVEKQRAEYRARKVLRKVIDDAGVHS